MELRRAPWCCVGALGVPLRAGTEMQMQSYVQMAEEPEKEHKKMLDKLSHQADDMKGSYKKLMT
ncbi:unnamed protein product [Triticum turgidum subsp. durum]|uniref:Uncharacterized protein n=1 Tax=Triticum turgidum subsp. durum TaxID=4567 RepID=A0A9R1Q749_TRITD|nr:unnamed protein product [Triticum turgidum subsp. durum]